MKYIVMEIQTFDTGAISTPTYAYDNRLAAESKYHALLSGAATSALPLHAVTLMTSDGRMVQSQSYRHEVEATPEEEETTPEE